MDFYQINFRSPRSGRLEVYPDFQVEETCKDLMIRGGDFYAVWDEKIGMWNRNRKSVQRIVDTDIRKFCDELAANPAYSSYTIAPQFLKSYNTNYWNKFQTFVSKIPDEYVRLDEKVTFQNSEVKKTDYVSKRLSYSLAEGDTSAWEEIISTLYDPEERQKIEWTIGSILTGASKKIEKFLVFYGPQGSGKSTIIKIIAKLLKGYCTNFKAESIVKGNDQFNLDFLSTDPLLAYDMDVNLSRIESNALLNTLVSHEPLRVNEKFKDRYPTNPICTLILGTNQPVKITDAKSGIIRRLIDVEPSGRLILPEEHYDELIKKVDFELGAIAYHCIDVFKKMGKTYYNSYKPERMMYRTDAFFNFMVENQDTFINEGGISAMRLWEMWKNYCSENGVEFTRKRFEIVDEAKNYFNDYKEMTRINGKQVRSWLCDLNLKKLRIKNEPRIPPKPIEEASWLNMTCTKSLLDDILKDCQAQYEVVGAEGRAKPDMAWKDVKTKLKDIDTSKVHYVRVPGNLIVIDFDLKNDNGEKDRERNLKAAGSSEWPPTYAEFSKGGNGVHLHYWYDGDVKKLACLFSDDIEIKVFPEDQLSTLRRRVSFCNDLPIAHISSGLPFKEEKVINWKGVKDDRHLRNLILKALRKEVAPGHTVTCVNFIAEVLKQAQKDGMAYDVRDLGPDIEAFAAHSTNNAQTCMKVYWDMKLQWPEEKNQQEARPIGNILDGKYTDDAQIIILDCEVTPNLFLVEYKEIGEDKPVIKLFNPKPSEIEALFSQKIVGHNVKGYDNDMLWARWLGYSNQELADLSAKKIAGEKVGWREAQNVSYTDTYDVSSDKKGLKRIEIEMHQPHKEMEIDWTKPLPESEWDRLAAYCENDVRATEAYVLSKGWQADFKARQILAALTGMTVNDSTNNLTAQLIFGDEREPWHEFVYPDLKKMFPLYRFEYGKSWYEDELIGEGGRVYAEPGAYEHVVTFDVASMHPTSIIVENGFGKYTKNYKDLYEARIAIKHGDYDLARTLFDGKLAPYLDNKDDADALSHALKIALNSVYGMTAAHFQNRFKDPRNVDNWVAKRGALFMEKLRREVQARGGHVVHIKTDSIKLVNPTEKLQNFVLDFGKQYGYTFEIESRYEKICLVNHAVYIALMETDDPGWLKACKKAEEKGEPKPTRWTATGAQFQHPYVFKKLFSKEPMEFWDYCETKTVKTAMYLDFNETLEDVSAAEKDREKIVSRMKKLQKVLPTDVDYDKAQLELKDLPKDIEVLDEEIAKGHHYVFVGKAGEFCPIRPGLGGGLLMRKDATGGYGYATGAKGYRWMESENVKLLPNWKQMIDIRYFRGLIDTAIETISKYCDFQMFVMSGADIITPDEKVLDINIDPWVLPCGSDEYEYCSDCPNFSTENWGYCCKLGYNIENTILGED